MPRSSPSGNGLVPAAVQQTSPEEEDVESSPRRPLLAELRSTKRTESGRRSAIQQTSPEEDDVESSPRRPLLAELRSAKRTETARRSAVQKTSPEEDDVESSPRRPLIAELRSTKRTESARRSGSVEAGCTLPPQNLVARKTYQIIDSNKPPYQVVNNYTILFKAIMAVILYFTVGTLSFWLAEDDLFGIKTESFIDALYFCVVTLTSVGYGDLVPDTTLGKLFTSFYIFVGFGLVGALVSGAANYIVEMQEKMLIHTIKRKEHDAYAMLEEMDAENAFWKVLVSGMMMLTLIFMGIIFLVTVEEMTFVDAVYCVCVTVTTLGYGDHTFKTTIGRLFAAIWILTSTVCVAKFFLFVAELRTFSRQLELAHWVLHRRTTQTDLQAADIDGDGVVSAPEFVIFKLKELGKVDDDDVFEILEQFRQLDYDQSGTITLDDLRASQGEM